MPVKPVTRKTAKRRPKRRNTSVSGKSKEPAKTKKKLRPTVIVIGGVKVELQEPIKGRGTIPTAVIRKAVKETIEARLAEEARLARTSGK